MQFIHPSATLISSDAMMTEFMQIIEAAGRTCWQSEGKSDIQVQKLLENPEFDPDSYSYEGNPPDGDRIRLAKIAVSNKFLQHIVKIGHTSVLEHSAITVRIITDRAVTHQLVRHRLAAYSQESQRYVDYMNHGHVPFIMPEKMNLEPGYYGWEDQNLYPIHLDNICGLHLESFNMGTETTVDIGHWPEKGMPRTWVKAMHYAEETYKELRDSGVKAQDARSVLPNATKTDIVATYNIHMWRHVLQTRLHPSAQHDIRHIMGIILRQFMKSPLAPLFEDIAEWQKTK